MSALREAVVAGVGETEYSHESGRTELQLAAEACKAAMDDAGFESAAVDGLVTYTMDTNDELELQRCLGMPLLRWVGRSPYGGMGCTLSVQLAAAAVMAGFADAVIVYRALNGRSGRRYGTPESTRLAGSGGELHYAFGIDTAAKSYAAETQGYMRRYGVTSEDLGRYAVATRAFAASNPRAMYYGKPLSLEQHQSSRWIVEPWIRRYDCCLETDGGCALLVTSRELAKAGAKQPVAILGAAQSFGMGQRVAYDFYRTDEEIQAAKDALVAELERQTGIHPKDVDLAMIYDAFTPAVLMSLEDFGICTKGEARHFINDGQTGLGGAMPVNPNGGLQGEAYMHGLNNVIEGVRQLRGEGINQVVNAETALVTGGGALILGKG